MILIVAHFQGKSTSELISEIEVGVVFEVIVVFAIVVVFEIVIKFSCYLSSRM